jgi:multidrug resistance efflux pump
MLIRISLILVIVAALAAGIVNGVWVKDKITTLSGQRDDEKSQKVTALGQLASTRKELATTKATLAQTQQDLADTKVERDRANDKAATEAKRANDLSDKLAKTTQERDDAQNSLAAYKATDLTPEQIIGLNKSLKNAQTEIEAINGEKLVMIRTITRLTNELNKYTGSESVVKLRADLRGKIVVVDPKWDFVVLNIGEDQGVLENGELLVSREGKLLAKVIVRSVQKDRAIANLVPGWKFSDVMEGDDVCPAHPAS